MGWQDIDYPNALLGVLVVAIVLVLVVSGSTSTTAFGAYNPAWDGSSSLRTQADSVGLDSQIVRNTSRLDSIPSEGSVMVILSPDRPYTSTEAANVSQFVENGGTLLIAEDFGPHTNSLLSSLGASTRIDGRTLRDENNNYNSPALPVADNVSNHSLVANVSQLTLNHGTVVEPNGAPVLVNSSSFGYLDANANGELDENETLGRYPVASVEEIDNGRVIVVSDPSIFINAMMDRPGNRAFTRAVLDGHERLLLDYSHTQRLPPLALALLVVRESAAIQLLVGIGVLALVGVWARRPRLLAHVQSLFGRSNMGTARPISTEELTAAVQHRHPEWDEERIQRVVTRFEERRED